MDELELELLRVLDDLCNQPAYDVNLSLIVTQRRRRALEILDIPKLLNGETREWELPFIPEVSGTVPYAWSIKYRDITGSDESTFTEHVTIEEQQTGPGGGVEGDYLVGSVKQGDEGVAMVKNLESQPGEEAPPSPSSHRYCSGCGEEPGSSHNAALLPILRFRFGDNDPLNRRGCSVERNRKVKPSESNGTVTPGE